MVCPTLSWFRCKALYNAARNKRVGKPVAKNRYITRVGEDDYALELHGTAVLRYSQDGTVTVNTGGFWTQTTRKTIWDYGRINLWGTSKKVHWKRINFGTVRDAPYFDGIQIRDGKILNPIPDPIRIIDPDKRKQLVRWMQQYRKGLTIRCKMGVYGTEIYSRNGMSAGEYLKTLQEQDFSLETAARMCYWCNVNPKEFTEIYNRSRLALLEEMGAISYYDTFPKETENEATPD